VVGDADVDQLTFAVEREEADGDPGGGGAARGSRTWVETVAIRYVLLR